MAIQRLEHKRGADDAGLVAEVLKHAPEELLHVLRGLFNDVLRTGKAPAEWSETVFILLAKKAKAVHASDFRPIAMVRLLYKTFAYMVLGRIESMLDKHQPEEQHGFRKRYRIEKHLLTANLLVDKHSA